MFACLGFLLILASLSVSVEGQEAKTDQNECFAEQFKGLKNERRKDMVYIYSALKSIDKTLGIIKRQLDLSGKEKRSVYNPAAADVVDTGNQETTKDRRGVEDVGNVFVLLHDKALETSADVKTLLEETDDVGATLQTLSGECGRLSLVLEELEAIRENQEFYKKPRSCLELLETGHTLSGHYMVYAESNSKEFEVYCDQDTDGGGWTVFQRREDGSVDFFRDWRQYERGFGDVDGEFWLGNYALNQLAGSCCNELRVDMTDFEGEKRHANYSNFQVGPKGSNYALTVSGYSGDAGDDLCEHNGMEFSTYDADHDTYSESCAEHFKAGWWYSNCHNANLNGIYHHGAHESYADGVNWHSFKGYNYSIKFVEMKFRKRKD